MSEASGAKVIAVVGPCTYNLKEYDICHLATLMASDVLTNQISTELESPEAGFLTLYVTNFQSIKKS